MINNEISVVTVDMDGLLFHGWKEFKNVIFPKTYVPFPIVDALLNISEEMKSFKLGVMTEDAYWELFRKKTRCYIQLQEIYQIFKDTYTLDSKVVEYIKSLKDEGYRTAIVSNNFPTRVNALDKYFDFKELMDAYIFSYEVGAMKPDKKIYQALVDQLNVEPGQVIMADDNLDKLAGARELGIHTVHYKGDFDSWVESMELAGVTVNNKIPL